MNRIGLSCKLMPFCVCANKVGFSIGEKVGNPLGRITRMTLLYMGNAYNVRVALIREESE